MKALEKSGLFNRIVSVTERIERNLLVRMIRDGLVTMIPILMIGAFALVLQSFPLEIYQTFITTFAGGLLYQLFHIVYMSTFGIMSIYMTISFSVSFFTIKDPDNKLDI